ncbi:MAG TPA: DUF2188 domain-containing protein [Novosphingobium sp.]
MANQIHVLPHGEGWDVRKDGAGRSSKHTDNKDEAVEFARDVAKREGLELVIHNGNGQISQKDSFGNDKNPPKG